MQYVGLSSTLLQCALHQLHILHRLNDLTSITEDLEVDSQSKQKHQLWTSKQL